MGGPDVQTHQLRPVANYRSTLMSSDGTGKGLRTRPLTTKVGKIWELTAGSLRWNVIKPLGALLSGAAGPAGHQHLPAEHRHRRPGQLHHLRSIHTRKASLVTAAQSALLPRPTRPCGV